LARVQAVRQSIATFNKIISEQSALPKTLLIMVLDMPVVDQIAEPRAMIILTVPIPG
jgi:hypothetical protein